MSKCIMELKGDCTGYTLGRCKGMEKCKFGKTKIQQKTIEEAIVRHIITDGGYLYYPLKSRIDGSMLLPAGTYVGLEV